jgi:hypothetical protein
MFVSKVAHEYIVAERDRLIRENKDLRDQVKSLTDALAIANRIPPPYAKTAPPRMVPISQGETPYRLAKRLEAESRRRAEILDRTSVPAAVDSGRS